MLDLLITNLEHFCNVFFCDLTSVLFTVARNIAAVSLALVNPTKVTDFLSAVNTKFSSLSVWILPSLYAILYLSSSNVSKNSLVEVIVIVAELPLTLNVNCCLVAISDELKSMLDIAGSGISETKLEFAESIIWGLTILKSLVTKVEPDGNSFWQTPVTSVADATTVICDPLALTAVTLLNVGSVSPDFWYFTISLTLIPRENLLPATVTVPPVVIEYSVPAGAGLPSLERTVSALNSLSPTSWNMDFTSSIEFSVTAVIVLVSFTPFTLIGSSTINVPDVEVNVKDVALLAAAFKCSLAPLLWPSINDPSTAVRPLLTVIDVNVCISHKNNSYLLVTPEYPADSNL